MYKMSLHKPRWIHGHRPDWHGFGVHFGHLVHDPRFWGAIALIILFGLLIMAIIFSRAGSREAPKLWYPISPFGPYAL